MRIFIGVIIKLVLCAGIAFFAFVNYRFYSFDNGWSIVEVNEMSTRETISELASINKIEYYKKTFKNNEYKVFIATKDRNYLLDATEDDIDAIKALSILSDNKPQKVTPVPFYIEIIVGIIILVIPVGGRKKT